MNIIKRFFPGTEEVDGAEENFHEAWLKVVLHDFESLKNRISKEGHERIRKNLSENALKLQHRFGALHWKVCPSRPSQIDWVEWVKEKAKNDNRIKQIIEEILEELMRAMDDEAEFVFSKEAYEDAKNRNHIIARTCIQLGITEEEINTYRIEWCKKKGK